ncbi:hypothetical protein HMPREF9140_01260 [Prevotella micans F0438]|uniref:DNA 3'-5' helicase n=1 Tax=Prevotella micans F0438 TaxID=883158 RepID=H1Q2X2_9BACT|nr:UvrD-helicase domain-containing protein [Prevotella micans]EHO69570.1 hypothetical protein HMPREF9140_01260 [Prevotella micans F0438]
MEKQHNSSLLNELNDMQREAVMYNDGPSLVIAGAGSGKTRVLTYKIAYLLEQGMKPWNILALTFTNKAAREMKDRVANLINYESARQLFMGTFHSVFARILRIEAEHIGFGRDFTIYDEADSRSLLKNIIKGMALDDKLYKPAAIYSRISMAKNNLVTAEAYAADRDAIQRDLKSNIGALWQIFQTYQARCRQANAMDFDDLLLNTFLLFRDNEEVKNKYARAFEYILVDEYQDTNFAQVSILNQISSHQGKICVVGDDYQSIYSFRGANIDNILSFREQHSQAKLFKLERNYRSTRKIVEAANSLMKHNRRQIPKDVYSENDDGERVVYKPCYSDKEEAAVVTSQIERIRQTEGGTYADFAILYRTNAQSRTFEEEFRRRDIPYRIYGGLSFYQRKEIKDAIAYFRLIINPHDEEAIRRVINYPARGIGAATIAKIASMAMENQTSFWDAIAHPEVIGLSGAIVAKLTAFRDMINEFIACKDEEDAFTLARKIIFGTGMEADIKQGREQEDIARQENLEALMAALQEFVETATEEGRTSQIYLENYLQEVALYSDLDKKDDNEPRVTLMTIHAAKGLEFPTVFVVGLEENLFPSIMATHSMNQLEEERRLLYVAITRAERHCFLTNAKNRYQYGKPQFCTPSRFLRDIAPEFIDGEVEVNSFADQVEWGGYGQSRSFGRWQNANPVGSQFKADPRPKITSPSESETPIDPLSPRTRARLAAERSSSFRRISSSDGGSSYQSAASSKNNIPRTDGLAVGKRIEHQRFGVGIVETLEGIGENARATIDFRNVGRKTLLLKFAKFRIL